MSGRGDALGNGSELVDAGYVRRVDASAGRATTYERLEENAGDV